MMMLDEDYVRRDRLQKGYVGALAGELLERFFRDGVQSISEIGVIGDPTRASAEKGRRYFEIYQACQEKAIRKKLKAWHAAHPSAE